MSLIPFPNVPNVAGVPALWRSATIPTVDALVNQGISAALEAIFGSERWGIYDQAGNLALDHDVFGGIEFKNASLVSTYVQEEGAFASYNKVNTPYDCRVRLLVGSDVVRRNSFLTALDLMLKSIDTYSVVTPDFTYTEATLQNYQYRRTSRSGVRIIEADLWFLEVRKAIGSEQPQPSEPAGADSISLGQIQTQSYSAVNGAVAYAQTTLSEAVNWSPWQVL